MNGLLKKRKPTEPARRRWFRFWAASALLLTSFGFANALREDELECEQAVAELEACCPGFVSAAINCEFSVGCGTTTYPALTLRESQCITGTACSELQSNKVCERAADAGPIVVGEEGGTASRTEVCP